MKHDFGLCANNAEACRPRLEAFWQQISEHYKDAPANVMFEILNEPNGKITPARIRRRTVVIGPAFWNSITALKQLKLPTDDRNIIVTVHYYLPMTFTHQGARWNRETANLSGVTWGTDAEKR
jgi:endoglucanase